MINYYTKRIVELFLSLFNPIRKLFVGKNERKDIAIVLLFQRLGDTIFTFPALQKLLEIKNGRIVIVSFYENAPLIAKYFPEVKIIKFDRREFKVGKRIPSMKMIGKLKRISANELYDLSGGIHTAFLSFILPVNKKYGLNEIYLRKIYDKFETKLPKRHLAENFLSVINGNYSLSELFPLKTEKVKTILIAPFAGWRAKEWGIEKFTELSELLAKKFEVAFSFPDEMRNNIHPNYFKNANEEIYFTADTETLIEVIDKFDLIIGNDSGPVYIAYMLGKRTVSIYGPTNPKYSAPIDAGHLVIQQNVHCSPKEDFQYCETDAGRNDCNDFICMNRLKVNFVYSEIMKFIDNVNAGEI